ncbi:hypothetical protein [uncultured Desulfobacter sp.]|uniref:hypothetical protein n=1 Tax=uncultured Desulfobacter sp. TaxID=240139 RepID=UPI0029C885CA|nr:hypothetical protein [uncultured Desulfobacter sp.]
MASIKLIIEGENALKATTDLVNLHDITVKTENLQEKEKFLEPALIAIIVDIAANIAVTVTASAICSWYKKWKKNKIDRIIIIYDDDKRIFFEDASENEIAKILKTLQDDQQDTKK